MGYKTDYTISNNGTKENLEEEIELMLECLTPPN
jgi:dephospho-CoA kinase